MSKSDLMDKIAEQAHVTKKQAEDVMDAFEGITIDSLKNGGEITLTGFGTFMAKERHARMGVNPQKPTERIKIPSVTVPKFKSGKALKDALKAGNSSTIQPEEPNNSETGKEASPAE
ncbi:HU family DNA-binding protein [Patescibacteria group bacterium]|nr:HU family DNA-binding protein [Patescibacteria group bacterium]MBU1890994.1 HU family DNA-binding protein [Patescibacteria group bacterium]